MGFLFITDEIIDGILFLIIFPEVPRKKIFLDKLAKEDLAFFQPQRNWESITYLSFSDETDDDCKCEWPEYNFCI